MGWFLNHILRVSIILSKIFIHPYLSLSRIVDSNGIDIDVEKAKLFEQHRQDLDYMLQNKKGFWFGDEGELTKSGEVLCKYLLDLSGAEEGLFDLIVIEEWYMLLYGDLLSPLVNVL